MLRHSAWAAVLLIGLGGSVHADDGPTPVESAAARLSNAAPGVLRDAFGSAEPFVREAACEVVARRGTAEPGALTELVAATGDPVVAVRLAATRALGRLGDAAAPAIERLERLAGWATEIPQRRAAVLALSRIPSADEALRRVLVDETLRSDSLHGLIEDAADGVPVLVRLSSAPEWRTRHGAVQALARVPAASTSSDLRAAASAAVVARLDDGSSAVRVAALLATRDVGGGSELGAAHVERAFGEDGSGPERRALLVALADGAAPVRAAAVQRAAASDDPRAHLTAVRLAHLTRTWDELTLAAVARIASLDDERPAREAGACLRHAGSASPLTPGVAAGLRPALAHASDRVATEAAAALALGGHDRPDLAAPLARLLSATTPGEWTQRPMSRPPTDRHRNLRAGASPPRPGEVVVPELPRVPLLALDELPPLLARHREASIAALLPLLAHASARTRADAAWTFAEVADPSSVRERLAPLLDDASLDVRIVAGVRLAGIGAHEEAVVRSFVGLLAADRGDGLLWDGEMIGALRSAPPAAVAALVDAFAACAEADGSWRDLPGGEHVRPMLAALGAPGHARLVDEFLAGDPSRRSAVRRAFAAAGGPDDAARARLDALRDDPKFGPDARAILD